MHQKTYPLRLALAALGLAPGLGIPVLVQAYDEP